MTTISPADLRRVGAELAAESVRFAALGWMRATSGNLSVVVSRAPLLLAVTVSGQDKGELTASDVVVVDEHGAALPGEAGQPSAEAALHARALFLAGAGAAIHVHPVSAVAAAHRWPSGIEIEGLEMLKALGRAASGDRVRIPVIENSQDMRVLGDRLAAVFDPRVPGVVVAGHGLYAWGDDLHQARHHTEAIEWLLEVALATR